MIALRRIPDSAGSRRVTVWGPHPLSVLAQRALNRAIAGNLSGVRPRGLRAGEASAPTWKWSGESGELQRFRGLRPGGVHASRGPNQALPGSTPPAGYTNAVQRAMLTNGVRAS